MNEQQIQEFLDSHDYDIRESHNARWIDQKCTPDVIWSIADFIGVYVDEVNDQFTVNDIWHSDYAQQSVDETYSKPGTKSEKAGNEYDKFFSQPINLLCYAGVIKDIGTGKRHSYIVENKGVLEYIARNDIYSYRFLVMYITNVLKDSGLYNLFDTFFEEQNKSSFARVKEAFIAFYKRYTPVQGDFEPKRIFTKVINPLACNKHKLGSVKGRLSERNIPYSDLMYNRDNFRDVNSEKPKEITRKEWEERIGVRPNIGYWTQLMNSAKRRLKQFNTEYRFGLSELSRYLEGHDDSEPATQIHHIFPRNEFPAIMHYLENLICLTPNEHFGFAHPNNVTGMIDLAAQKELLIAKTYSIEENLTSNDEEHIYEFDNLLHVLSEGWDDSSVLDIAEDDYCDVLYAINCHYN